MLFADVALAETTGSFYLGHSHTGDSDIRVTQPGTGSDATFRNVSWRSESFKNPVYYGFRITHFLEERPEWGIGFDYTHDKVYAKTGRLALVEGTWNGVPVNEIAPIDRRVQSFGISHGVNLLGVNLYRRWMYRTDSTYSRGRWQPYIGAGLTYYLLHPENVVNGQNNEEGYKGGGFGYQMLAGLHYGLTPALGVFVEAKYNSGKVAVGTAGGRAETELNCSQLLAGASVLF